jgi:hypothetical protein
MFEAAKILREVTGALFAVDRSDFKIRLTMSKYVFRQLVDLLPHRVFDGIVEYIEGYGICSAIVLIVLFLYRSRNMVP